MFFSQLLYRPRLQIKLWGLWRFRAPALGLGDLRAVAGADPLRAPGAAAPGGGEDLGGAGLGDRHLRRLGASMRYLLDLCYRYYDHHLIHFLMCLLIVYIYL